MTILSVQCNAANGQDKKILPDCISSVGDFKHGPSY